VKIDILGFEISDVFLGTVRNLSDEKKYAELKQLPGPGKARRYSWSFKLPLFIDDRFCSRVFDFF